VILLAQQFEAEARPKMFKHLVISDTGKKNGNVNITRSMLFEEVKSR
jgi:hypothetical protein